MKKKIVSLLLTGTLVLSAGTGVSAAESLEGEATEAAAADAQSGDSDEKSGDLIGGLLSLIGLKDEYDTINELGDKIGIGGLDDLANNLGINTIEDLSEKLGIGDIQDLGETLGIGDLTDKLFGEDAVVDINSLVDGAVSSGILESLVGEENMPKVEGLLEGLGLTDGSESAADAVEGAVVDFAEAFPSWNPDSESLSELIDFVSRCTDESDPAYIDPQDRIATFDMDGTILCEKAPVYVDYCLTMHRVLDDDTYKATEEEKKSMEQIREHAYSTGETFHPEGLTKNDIVASAFAGMTPAEFRS